MVDFSHHQRMLPGMKPRPEVILENKRDGKDAIRSESIATFFFIKGCENYELRIEGKAAKVMCENCTNVTIVLERQLVSGTMELLRCYDIFVKLLNSIEVPIFQIDDSKDIWIEITNKSQVKSVYFQQSNGIKVLLSGPQGTEFVVDTSLNAEKCNIDDITQWVAHWSEGFSNMVTEKVNRKGIYPEEEQREARQ